MFALHNLCDLNPTSWAASMAQLVEQLPWKQEVVGLSPTWAAWAASVAQLVEQLHWE